MTTTTLPARLRDRVRDLIQGAGLGLPVIDRAPMGQLSLPCVVLGMPRWRAAAEHGMDVWEVPVVVVVALNGADPVAGVDQLEATWPVVAEALRAAVLSDQTLGGVCSDARVEGAEFGQVRIGAQEYPSYHINLKLNSFSV